MAYFLETLGLAFIVIILILISTIYIHFKCKYTYWTKRGVPCVPSIAPLGNATKSILSITSFGEVIQEIYMKLKSSGNRYGGFYLIGTPNFLPIDPDLIKTILTAEFRSFHDRAVFVDEEIDPMTGNLFSLKGYKWRNLRVKLTSTFTSGKMKMMFKTMLVVGEELEQTIGKYENKAEAIDIKDLLARFGTDIIGTVAFGLDCNSLKDPDSEFRKHGLLLFANSVTENIRNLGFLVIPGLLKYFKMPAFNPKVTQFFTNVIRQTVNYREKNDIIRNDFLDLLIKLKNNENINDDDIVDKEEEISEPGLTINEMTAQCLVFFSGGFETSSSTMTFCLYELCLNQQFQDKLREEIQYTLKKHNGQLTYDAISEMRYMDKVIKETLRKYPIATFLSRECVEEFKIPDSNVTLEKGTNIIISVLGLHRDPEHYPDPLKFDPERFSEETKLNNHPYTYLPFGEGPRNCIGMRFALMQSKVGLAILLKNYKFTMNKKTVVPMKVDPTSIVLASKDGIWLNIENVN